jgi:hypothetical protein
LLSAHDVQCKNLQSDFNLKEDKILKKLEEANKQKELFLKKLTSVYIT